MGIAKRDAYGDEDDAGGDDDAVADDAADADDETNDADDDDGDNYSDEDNDGDDADPVSRASARHSRLSIQAKRFQDMRDTTVFCLRECQALLDS